MIRTRVRIAALALVAATAGCAENAAGQESPSLAPSASSPAPSSPQIPVDRRPSGPPKDPTDQIKKTDWVVGTVTAGGSGPCYGLETDDGTRYALHATDGTKLIKGTRMRVRTQATKLRIYCGPGRLVEMTASEPVR